MSMTGDMTSHVDYTGKSGNMGGKSLYINRQRRGISSKALRTKTKAVYAGQRFCFHFCVKGIGVSCVHIADQRPLCNYRALLNRAAKTDTQNHRGGGDRGLNRLNAQFL